MRRLSAMAIGSCCYLNCLICLLLLTLVQISIPLVSGSTSGSSPTRPPSRNHPSLASDNSFTPPSSPNPPSSPPEGKLPAPRDPNSERTCGSVGGSECDFDSTERRTDDLPPSNNAQDDSNTPKNTFPTAASNFTAPSFLGKAIDSCKAARDTLGEYPSVYSKLVYERNRRWKKQRENGDINFIQTINDKLGGYLFAAKLGIRTPRVLFCGTAKDLPRNMASLGDRYVVKPLEGYNSRGVKVVKEGVNILKGKKVTYRTLVEEYGPEGETVVEELVEGAHPKYDGVVPPDYKFHVYEGRPEMMWFVDRNRKDECKDYYDVSSKNWTRMEGFLDTRVPNCARDVHRHLDPSRREALMDAVRVLAGNIAGGNWIRIDMFDGKDGPVLGEFTPFSSNGKATPLDGCVMSYLFIAHADHGGGLTDDAETVRDQTKKVSELKTKLGMNGIIGLPETEETPNRNERLDFFTPEGREWEEYNVHEKCNKVIEAQQELDRNSKESGSVATR